MYRLILQAALPENRERERERERERKNKEAQGTQNLCW
jgi:hypothetical protein